MTDEEERAEEGAVEEIEDLEAPVDTQEDVAGGVCRYKPSCTAGTVDCIDKTCKRTEVMCKDTTNPVVWNH